MVFDAGQRQLSPDRTPDTSSASLRRGCRDQDRVTSETRPRFDAQITRGGVNSRKKLVTGRRVIASASFRFVSSRLVSFSPMNIERARSRGGFVVERGRGKKEKGKKEKFDRPRGRTPFFPFLLFARSNRSSSSALRFEFFVESSYARARESSTKQRRGGPEGRAMYL